MVPLDLTPNVGASYPVILMREHLSGKIGPADTQDPAYYFLSPGVGSSP